MRSASLLVTVLLVLVAPSTHCYPLINLDWATLEREVTIRYFSPDKWASSQVGNIDAFNRENMLGGISSEYC